MADYSRRGRRGTRALGHLALATQLNSAYDVKNLEIGRGNGCAIDAVEVDPDTAALARRRYGCLTTRGGRRFLGVGQQVHR